MTVKQIELKLTELIHREPFAPFLVELKDGRELSIGAPVLAFDHSGAVFIDQEGVLVDFDFKQVRDIHMSSTEAVA